MSTRGMVAARNARASRDDEETLGKTYDVTLGRRLWKYIRPHAKLLVLSIVTLPVIALLSLVQPYLFKVVIDSHVIPRKAEGLLQLCLLFFLVLVCEHVVRYAQTLWLQLLGLRATTALRADLYRHLFGLRAAYFDRQPVGRLMTRLTNDVESINEAFAAGIVTLVGDVVTIIGVVIAMLLLNVKLTLFALAVAPLLFLVAVLFRRLLRDSYREIRQKLARINGFLQEHVTGIKVVQICVREQRAAREFDQLNRGHRDANVGAITYDAALYAVVELLGTLAIAGLIWWGAGEIVQGALTFGVLAAFIEYQGRFFAPIRDLSTKFTVMQQAMAGAERIFKLLDTVEPDAPAPSVHQTPAIPPSPSLSPSPSRIAPSVYASDGSRSIVTFDDVSFQYRPGEPVLRNVSFSIPAGRTLAVVGATGSGKTTVIRLLTRLYEPTSGTIWFDGQSLPTLSRDEVRRRVVVVPQDVFLFSGSVHENVALWDRSLDDRVIDAARRVGLIRALDRRGRTLQDRVGERGVNLSAGERQLVAFARAMVRDPHVLVLDEATANVDPETERLIEEGTSELLRDRTSILIAHRLSTVERADSIVVFHRGRIVEQGTHATLISQEGVYAKLYRLQRILPPGEAAAPPSSRWPPDPELEVVS